jgi:hypothetical protein
MVKNLKQYKLLSLTLILAYVLSACSGVPAGAGGQTLQNDQSQEVVFTGTVEGIGAGQWTVSGQAISLTSTTSVDANIQVGDNVKVEAVVDQGGVVTAVRIESAGADEAVNANSNDDNTNTANSNDGNANDVQDDNSNADNSNANGNENDAPAGAEQEVFGIVQAITTDSINIDGVMYQVASFTEFKDLIAVGDLVKVHVILNADGTLTIREIEKSDGIGDDDNSNSNGSDDNPNGSDDNSNSNDDDNDDDDNNSDDSGNDNGDDDDNDNNSGSNNG